MVGQAWVNRTASVVLEGDTNYTSSKGPWKLLSSNQEARQFVFQTDLTEKLTRAIFLFLLRLIVTH